MEKTATLKTHDAVLWPRAVTRHDLKPFLCISWNSSRVLQERPLEKGQAVTSYYHKLTRFADK